MKITSEKEVKYNSALISLFQKGNTYLHLIATTHSPKIIHCLVSAGIDVQAQNKVSK